MEIFTWIKKIRKFKGKFTLKNPSYYKKDKKQKNTMRFFPAWEGISEEHSEGHPKGQFPPHMGGYKDRLCGLFFFVIFLKYILIMIQKLLRTGEKYIICIKKFYGGKIL